MADLYEPYVADPAEPPPRPKLQHLTVPLWTAIVVLVLASLVWMYFEGRGEEDPALQQPSQQQGADG